jgi:hypothetical protein
VLGTINDPLISLSSENVELFCIERNCSRKRTAQIDTAKRVRFQGACLSLCGMQIHAVIGPGNGLHPASRNQHRAAVKPVSGFDIQVA